MTYLREAIKDVEEALISHGYAVDGADWDAFTVSEIAVAAAATLIEAETKRRAVRYLMSDGYEGAAYMLEQADLKRFALVDWWTGGISNE